MSMQCDNAIYEGVDVSSIQVEKNEVYSMVKQNVYPESQKLPSISPNGRISTKTVVIVTVVTATILLLLLVAATASISVEIYKMKSAASSFNQRAFSSVLENVSLEMQTMAASNQQRYFVFSSMLESVWGNISVIASSNQQLSSLLEEYIWINGSLAMEMQQELMKDVEAKIQQLQNFSNSTAEMVAALDTRGAALDARGSALEAKVMNLVSFSNTTHQLLNDSISNVSSALALYPPPSCDALPTSAPAGYYRILSPYAGLVHCPPVTTQCGHAGRWSRWELRSDSQCRYSLREKLYSNKRLCVRNPGLASGCSSVYWSTTSPFSMVCGSVRGYQFGSPDAFNFSASIDDPYVDGVSITYGSPRQHIWSFAAARNEYSRYFGCGCIGGGSNSRPAFVGDDYFCDTGRTTGTRPMFYGDDPLWDGAGCGSNNNCCTFNTPPWFYKELPHYSYDFELRVCRSSVATEEDIGLEAVTIYVK